MEQVFNEGASLYENGELQEAMVRFERVIQLPDVPENVRRSCLYNVGMANMRLQRFATAITFFEQYIAMPGADAEKGTEKLLEAKRGAGVDVDQSSDQPFPVERAEQIFQQGANFYAAGDFRQAIVRFERVRQLPSVPDNVRQGCLFNIGVSNLRLGRPAVAITYFEQYLNMPGADAEKGNEKLLEARRGAGVPVPATENE
jgi:Tfp pilus assembly protein PilF